MFLASGLAYEAPAPAPVGGSGGLSGAPLLVWEQRLPGEPPDTATRTEPAAPVVDERFIYVGYSGVNGLLVLDRRDGSTVVALPMHAPVVSAPVLTDELVIVSDSAGYTSAFRRDALLRATPAWEHFSGAPILSSPTVAGDVLFLTNVDDLVYALEAATGKLVWRHAHKMEGVRVAELELFGAPGPAVTGDQVVVGFSDGFVVGLGASDGSPRWSAEIGEGAYPDIIAPAIGVGGSVVVGGYSEPLLSLNPETRAVQWRLPIGSATPFSLDGDTLWHGGTDGRLRRIDARTGNEVWAWDSGTGGSISQPVPTSQGVLVASSEGSLYLVDPERGTTRWTFEPGVLLTGVSGRPALYGDHLYAVSNAGVLYALRRTAPPAPRSSPDWVSPAR
jgi:outer membrane protein assembly factor BamB